MASERAGEGGAGEGQLNAWVYSRASGWGHFSRVLHYPVNAQPGYYALRGKCYPAETGDVNALLSVRS